MKQNVHNVLYLVFSLVVASFACAPLDVTRDLLGQLATPDSAAEVHESRWWYLETDGEDTPPCDEISPCRTLNYALSRATDNDRIFLGAGTFREPESSGGGLQHRIVDMNLTIEGQGPDVTIIDGYGDRSVFYIGGTGQLILRGISIQGDGRRGSGSCIEDRSRGRVIVEDVIVQDCSPYGISHPAHSELQLIEVIVLNAQADEISGGTGIFSAGSLTMEGGRVANNEWDGVIANNDLRMSGTFIEGNGLDGLVIRGSALVEDVMVRNNARDPELGLHHTGVLVEGEAEAEFINLHVDDNEACVAVVDTAVATLRDSWIEGCDESGLVVTGMAQAIVETSLIENTGLRFGGTSIGAGVSNGGHLTLQNSTVARNANGGITNYGELILLDSLLTGNRGHLPGLFNYTGASALVNNSLITDYRGDVPTVDNRGMMVMANSTISGNPGTGISAVTGSLTLRYVTITNNGGRGLAAPDSAEVLGTVANSLIVNNGEGDCYLGGYPSPLRLSGFNIDSDGSCTFGNTFPISEVLLGELADNGGPTQSHALQTGSVALDAASDGCLPADQRGASRPFGSACDVGAYEFNPTFGASAASLEVTGTPPSVTSDSDGPTVNTDSLCTKGPGSAYQVVQSVESGVLLEIVGRGEDGGWWVVDSPRYPGQKCWLPEANVDVPPALDVGDLPEVAVPPLPTATALLEAPAAPGQFGFGQVVCSANEYTVPLSWQDQSDNEMGFRLYRNGQLIATLNANATSYSDEPPATGSPVEYGLEAFNEAGASSRVEVTEGGCLY